MEVNNNTVAKAVKIHYPQSHSHPAHPSDPRSTLSIHYSYGHSREFDEDEESDNENDYESVNSPLQFNNRVVGGSAGEKAKASDGKDKEKKNGGGESLLCTTEPKLTSPSRKNSNNNNKSNRKNISNSKETLLNLMQEHIFTDNTAFLDDKFWNSDEEYDLSEPAMSCMALRHDKNKMNEEFIKDYTLLNDYLANNPDFGVKYEISQKKIPDQYSHLLAAANTSSNPTRLSPSTLAFIPTKSSAENTETGVENSMKNSTTSIMASPDLRCLSDGISITRNYNCTTTDDDASASVSVFNGAGTTIETGTTGTNVDSRNTNTNSNEKSSSSQQQQQQSSSKPKLKKKSSEQMTKIVVGSSLPVSDSINSVKTVTASLFEEEKETTKKSRNKKLFLASDRLKSIVSLENEETNPNKSNSNCSRSFNFTNRRRTRSYGIQQRYERETSTMRKNYQCSNNSSSSSLATATASASASPSGATPVE